MRDLIMGRVPNDFDVATDARPESVEALFPRAVTVGREFGVTILPFEDFQIEVATFREDGPYDDGRRPTHITFSTPEQDAKRRDFTINALFYDIDTTRVIDYVGGEADIKSRLLRAVGDPDKRFDEDKLRILRAVRFAAQLDFVIEPNTLEVVRRRAEQVKVVSLERIRDEVIKLMKSLNAPAGLALLHETGLWEVVFPELKLDANGQLAIATRARRGSATPELAALALLADFVAVDPKARLSIAQAMLKRLRFSNQESETVMWTLRMREMFLNPTVAKRASLIRALAHSAAPVAEVFYSADAEQDPTAGALFRDIHASVLQHKRELPQRFLNGDDLQKMGLAKGPGLGLMLEEAFDLQLVGQFKTRDEAHAWARAAIAKQNP